jgi:hypothetical protein
MIDAARLARTIAGAGLVYLAETSEVDEELEFLMVPKEFRPVNGGVRVYRPGADFTKPMQSYRHRFFTRTQIEELTAAEVEAQIARALGRRTGWLTLRSSILSVDDIEARRRELRRETLLEKTDTASRDELMQLYQAEIDRLGETVRQLESEKTLAEDLLDERDGEIETVRDSLRHAEYDAESSRNALAGAKRQVASMERAVETIRALNRLPSSLTDVIERIEQLHGHAISFAEAAKKSASKTRFSDVHLAWELLHAVATVLPVLAFVEKSKNLGAQFKARTGFELALTEGKQTNKDHTLAGLRQFSFEGRDWDMSPHVKAGKHPNWLRVHFALDQAAERVLVGHCGDHLDTAGTRRRA